MSQPEEDKTDSESSEEFQVLFDRDEDKKTKIYPVITVMSDDDEPDEITYERVYAEDPARRVVTKAELKELLAVPDSESSGVESDDSDSEEICVDEEEPPAGLFSNEAGDDSSSSVLGVSSQQQKNFSPGSDSKMVRGRTKATAYNITTRPGMENTVLRFAQPVYQAARKFATNSQAPMRPEEAVETQQAQETAGPSTEEQAPQGAAGPVAEEPVYDGWGVRPKRACATHVNYRYWESEDEDEYEQPPRRRRRRRPRRVQEVEGESVPPAAEEPEEDGQVPPAAEEPEEDGQVPPAAEEPEEDGQRDVSPSLR